MGAPDMRSASISDTTRTWSSVSVKGSRLISASRRRVSGTRTRGRVAARALLRRRTEISK